MSAGPRGSKDARAEALQRALGSATVTIDDATRAALTEWIEGIAHFNAKIDLTAARSDDELVDLMIADALTLASRLPSGARFVDVGTGAGAPGLGLAILRADLDATLVEPLDKRVAFLRRTVGALATHLGARVRVVRGRGQDLVAKGLTFDVALSRATLPPPEWLALGAELAPRGDVWCLLAQGDPPSIPGFVIADDVRYTWPLTSAARRAVRFKSA